MRITPTVSGTYDRHGNFERLPAAAKGRVAKSYPALRAEEPEQPEQPEQPEDLDDVREPDPYASAISGLCILTLCGGLFVCVIARIWAWLVEVVQ